jgi:hypothetical protein
MGRRRLAGVAGLAASVSIASLVLAEANSSGPGHPGVVPVLFIVFLASLFTLLAVALMEADRDVKRLSEIHETSPRWSMRRARKRLADRLARAARNGLTGTVQAARAGVAWLQQAARAGVARLQRELERERRRATLARLKKAWDDTLVLMGMPPKRLDTGSSVLGPPATPEASPQASGGVAPPWAALAAWRGGEGALATRRRRPLVRSRPPRSPGPAYTRRVRTWASRAVGSVPGRKPFGGDSNIS